MNPLEIVFRARIVATATNYDFDESECRIAEAVEHSYPSGVANVRSMIGYNAVFALPGSDVGEWIAVFRIRGQDTLDKLNTIVNGSPPLYIYPRFYDRPAENFAVRAIGPIRPVRYNVGHQAADYEVQVRFVDDA